MMSFCSRGETDITAVFGTAIPGSNPGGSTYEASATVGIRTGEGRRTEVLRGGKNGKTVGFPGFLSWREH